MALNKPRVLLLDVIHGNGATRMGEEGEAKGSAFIAQACAMNSQAAIANRRSNPAETAMARDQMGPRPALV